MFEFFQNLFDTTGFQPRWTSDDGNWTVGHGMLHIISDFAIGGAYFSIPAVLAFFLRRRRDVPFLPVFWLFVLFILACGFGHFIEATIFWQPWYRFSGVVKALTAIVSWVAVIGLIRIAPDALRLPTLASVNAKLEREIKERKEAEVALDRYAQQLERRNAELDEFAYVASHDLKAPLRAVQKISQWISEDLKDTLHEETQQNLVRLKQRVSRMNQLLDDLLEYSRVGRQEGNVETVHTSRLVREIVEMLDAPSEFKIEIDDLPTIVTHKTPLAQIFRNLISNAIKHHGSPAGNVRISATQSNGHILFSVEDDGPGIPSHYQDKVFQMFQTLRPRDDVEGSGMGLALVKKILDNRDCSVTVESGENQGAAFRFTWPLYEHAASA